MPWTPPSDPVTSTVITVAYAVANLLTQIRWLRLMTGNADPPSSAYVVVSDSSSATTWKKVPLDALADDAVDNRVLAPGAALANIGGSGITNPYLAGDSVDDRVLAPNAAVANLGFQPINKATDTGVGMLTFGSGQRINFAQENGSKIFLTSAGDYSLGCASSVLQLSTNQFVGLRNNGAAGGDYSASFDTLNNIHAFHGRVQCDTLMVGGVQASATPAAGRIPMADGSGKLDAWITGGGGSGGAYVPHTHGGDALIPGTVNGATVSAVPGAGRIPTADAGGKLDPGWIPAAAGGSDVPVGLVAMWGVNNTAPTGWVLETSFNGRFPVATGGTLGFALGTQGGSSAHGHTFDSRHAHSGQDLSVSGSTGTPSTTGTGGGIGASFGDGSHTHNQGNLDVGGSTSEAGSPSHSIPATANNHLPPYHAINFIRKT